MGNPLQYCCLEKSTERGAWQATVHGTAKSWTRLRDFHICTWDPNNSESDAMER